MIPCWPTLLHGSSPDAKGMIPKSNTAELAKVEILLTLLGFQRSIEQMANTFFSNFSLVVVFVFPTVL